MKEIILLEGLDCANCARELEEILARIDGVNFVSVDFINQKVTADCTPAALEKLIKECSSFEEVKVKEVKEARSADTLSNGNAAPAAATAGANATTANATLPPTARANVDNRVFGEKIMVENLCCANCARELEELLNAQNGIEAAVDFMNSRIVLNAPEEEAHARAIDIITHFEDVKIVSGNSRKPFFREHLKDIICLISAVVLFVPAVVLDLTKIAWSGNLAAQVSTYVLYALAYLFAGHPVLINTAKNVVKGRVFDENFLMTIASLGAVALGAVTNDGFFEGVAVMLLYQLGELLQSAAVGASRNSISDLMDLKSPSATLLKEGVPRVISPDELLVGDIILIKAGEKVPVDCRIIKGATTIDMKSLNGEPMPKEAGEGSEVLSGSINVSGAVEAEVIRAYSDSAAAKILELVENSSARRSKPEKFITKFAKYYTPAVCAAAILVAVLVPTLICAVSGAFGWATYSDWIYKSLTFLVISCPCALVISVPLSYFGGIGRCAKFGVLVKGSTCLDSLALCTVAAFDKTGTVTEGVFGVKSYSSERALELAAAAEKLSTHPVARAFSNVPTGVVATDAREIAGKGIICTAEGKTLLCGNDGLLRSNGVRFEPLESPSALVYVAFDGQYVGVIELDDSLKEGVGEALSALRQSGVKRTVMLTGDAPARAQKITKEAGIDECFAALLPDGKLQKAEELKKDGKLMYVGDGINDAPVMTCADCAVSMGKTGSDAAIEASDVVIVTDSLSLIPKARRIARGTRSIVMQNIVGSIAVKLAVMACGIAIPAFPLIISVVADVGVMLLAVLNAMRTALIK